MIAYLLRWHYFYEYVLFKHPLFQLTSG